MRLAVVGTGYVGLVTGTCFADYGHSVVCVDVDRSKIDALNRGIIPIYEPGLDELVVTNTAAGRLRFTSDLPAAVASAELVIVAVGTPARRADGHADLSYVRTAIRSVAASIEGPTVIVMKSTVPVGTGDEVEQILFDVNPNAVVSVVSNPEFLREGSAIEDFKCPDRIIVGAEEAWARDTMAQLYAPLVRNNVELIFTGRRTAELTKYAANSFLALKVTFINEIADLCEHAGANVKDVAHGIGLDQRIGSRFLNAGPGFGGSCFPKDIQALAKTAQDHGSPVRLVETTIAINEQRKRAMARKIARACENNVRGKRIALLGLAFKPNTDDMRDAPSIAIIQSLVDFGAVVTAYDPVAMEHAKGVLPPIEYATNPYDAVLDADAVVLVTEWDELASLDLDLLASRMKGTAFVDLRNIYERSKVEKVGLLYHGVGVAPQQSSLDVAEAAE